MKYLISTIVFLFWFFCVEAQKLEITTKTSLGFSLINSETEEFNKSYLGFGLSSSLSFEYVINEKISVGLDPSYSYLNRRFQTPYFFSAIPEILSYKNHYVNSHGLQLPLMMKYHKNDFFLFGQLGLTHFFYSEYKIEGVSYHIYNGDNKNIVLLKNEKIKIKPEHGFFGQFFALGLGKTLHIANLNFLAELKYNKDISNFLYQPIADNDVDEIEFKTQSFYLSIAYKF